MRVTGEPQVLWGDEEKSVCADSKEFRHNPLVFPLVSFLFSVKHVVYTHLCVNFAAVSFRQRAVPL